MYFYKKLYYLMKYAILSLVVANFSCKTQSSDKKLAVTMPEVDEREFTAVPAPE